VDSVGALVARRGCELVVRLPQQPCVAEVDPRRVERVLRNLLLNAIEHGNGLPVEVRLAADDDAVAVTVRDHGMGFRDGDADHVFRRFWRADPARTRRTGGTGLGLSIALEDAHLHGGWLQAWGALGSGAQFRLTLPRRARRTLVRSPLPLQPAATAAPSPATAMSEVNRG
jgi:two-component system sensor histidine kinase MtrB